MSFIEKIGVAIGVLALITQAMTGFTDLGTFLLTERIVIIALAWAVWSFMLVAWAAMSSRSKVLRRVVTTVGSLLLTVATVAVLFLSLSFLNVITSLQPSIDNPLEGQIVVKAGRVPTTTTIELAVPQIRGAELRIGPPVEKGTSEKDFVPVMKNVSPVSATFVLGQFQYDREISIHYSLSRAVPLIVKKYVEPDHIQILDVKQISYWRKTFLLSGGIAWLLTEVLAFFASSDRFSSLLRRRKQTIGFRTPGQ